MTYEIDWCIPGRVIKAVFSGNMTLQEAEAASELTA